MRFCPKQKCFYWGHVSEKYPRKCYYEKMCFRGWLDDLIGTFKLLFWKPY